MNSYTVPGRAVNPYPPSPPPILVPPLPPGPPDAYEIKHAVLSRGLFHYVYVWLTNGEDFWVYPTHIRNGAIEGYRWRDGRWGAVTVPLSDTLDYYI